jgi:hypothetical protein
VARNSEKYLAKDLAKIMAGRKLSPAGTTFISLADNMKIQ